MASEEGQLLLQRITRDERVMAGQPVLKEATFVECINLILR